jgi:hypothetical protein
MKKEQKQLTLPVIEFSIKEMPNLQNLEKLSFDLKNRCFVVTYSDLRDKTSFLSLMNTKERLTVSYSDSLGTITDLTVCVDNVFIEHNREKLNQITITLKAMM